MNRADLLTATLKRKRWMIVDVGKMAGRGLPEPDDSLYRATAAAILAALDEDFHVTAKPLGFTSHAKRAGR
jgi:hypothetical protein